MSKDTKQKCEDEVPTILYTAESKDSAEQTKEDLQVEDPPVEIAIAVLRGSESETHRESKTH